MDSEPNFGKNITQVNCSGGVDQVLTGCRRMIITCVGWLALCGAQIPAKENAQGQSTSKPSLSAQAAPPSSVGAAVRTVNFSAYPNYNADSCYHSPDKEAADLCAQWRAAIAAEEAVHETRRATAWSIIGTILSVFSLIAVGLALFLTVISNRIARDTAKRQLRAYLTGGAAGLWDLAVGKKPSIHIEILNSGETPAYRVRISAASAIGTRESMPNMEPYERNEEQVLGRGAKSITSLAVTAPIDSEAVELISNGNAVFYVIVNVKYVDIFGEEHTTQHTMVTSSTNILGFQAYGGTDLNFSD